MRTVIQGPLAMTSAGATAEKVLRACVHCGLCNAACPTYQITGDELDGPRGRIYLMKQALEGEPVGRLTQVHLDRCLSCRACETTCPSGVEYHRLYDVGRQVVADSVKRPWTERLARLAIRHVAPYPARLAPLMGALRLFGLAGPARAAPIPRVSPNDRQSRMVLLAGCVQSVGARHINAATGRVFAHVGVAVAESPNARCCGALSAHLEAPEEARAFARRNIEAWSQALDGGAAGIIVNASGCAAFIRDYPDLLADDPAWAPRAKRIAAAVRDPIEILGELSLDIRRAPAKPAIAVHEPCTLQHGTRLSGRIAALLARLGYEPAPVADAHLCCGSAGAYSLLHPTMAKQLRTEKLAVLQAGRPSTIYTANIGCLLFLGQASRVPVRHWIEAVDDLLD